MFKGIKARLMFTISSLIIVLFGISFIFSFNQTQTILQGQLYGEAHHAAMYNAQTITEVLKGYKNLVVGQVNLAALEAYRAALEDADSNAIMTVYWAKEKNALIHAAELDENIETFFTVDLDGETQITSNEFQQYNISDREYFQEVLKTSQPVISKPVINKDTGELVFVIAAPVIFNGKLNGVLGGTFKLDILQKLVIGMNLEGNGYGWIVGSDHNTIAHPEKEYLNNQDFSKDNQELQKIVEQMVEGENGREVFTIYGQRMGIAFAPIEISNWSLALVFDEIKAMEPLKAMQRGYLLIGIISLLVGIGIAFVISGYFANPIIKLNKITQQIAEGDFTDSGIVLKKRKDEIGSLSDSIRNMRDSLRSMISQIINVSDRVASMSEELSASGNEVGSAADQVGKSIEQVAYGAQEQANQIEQTTYAVKNLIDEIGETEKVSKEISSQGVTVMNDIEDGNRYMSNSIRDINYVKDQTTELAQKIELLGRSSSEIGQIVDLINAIAEQTNLLALNAAIEAARAGNAGLGFGVVANEIRDLADESTNATAKIARLIDEIQKGVGAAIIQINDGVNSVDTSVKTIEGMETVFNGIQRAADQLQTFISKVNEKTRDMALNSDNIGKIMSNLSLLSEESASNAEEVAASSEEQVAATQEIISSANHLAEVATELAEVVGRFKL